MPIFSLVLLFFILHSKVGMKSFGYSRFNCNKKRFNTFEDFSAQQRRVVQREPGVSKERIAFFKVHE
jgi:hypothetical protein